MTNQIAIITEKPDASKRIAESLADKGTLKKNTDENNVTYYEFKRNGKKHLVVCAVGHLFNLTPIKKGGGWSYPIFDADWKPSFEVRKESAFSKKYFEVVQRVIKEGSEFVVATDYDTEGSVIGFNVLRFLAGVKDGKRMKFSTLTKDELIESYDTMAKHLDFPQIETGLTRHMLDWLWGINLTRALTLALKSQAEKGFAILSSGRVQTPTLYMLLEKELEIRKFKSKPFWELQLHLKLNGKEVIANYEKDKLWDKKEADGILAACKGKDAVVKDIKKREYKQSPPVPFNTTDLQSEAYAQFKFSPTQTMRIAEGLYQAGWISYPRSSSQKLPPAINYEKIMKALGTLNQYSKFVQELMKKRLAPKEGSKEDPAHPAVYPTFEVADMKKLNSQQKRLYDLIVRRFLSVFGDDATRESNTVTLDVNGKTFTLIGKRTIEPGWTKYYENYLSREELILPDLEIGQKLKVAKLEQLAKETQPPGRYSQGSILKEMEKRNLGTKATRAEILQTLYNRKYILNKSIQITKLGEAVSKALKEYAPRIISEDLTKHFESEMDMVYNGKKKREEVVDEAKDVLTDILKDFKKNEKNIGKKLLDGLVESRKDERRLGTCINCKVGELRILRSRFSGKFFVGCSSYFKCKKCGFTRNACKCKCPICGGVKGKCKCTWKDKKWEPSCQTGYPLPGGANIQAMGKVCDKCGTPIIQVWRKGRRPFRMCLSTTCETKKDWGKPKKKVKGMKIEEKVAEVKESKEIPAKKVKSGKK
jgi:DNA topoisomerase-1